MASFEKSVIDVCQKVIRDWLDENMQVYVEEQPLTQEEKDQRMIKVNLGVRFKQPITEGENE